MDWNTLRGSAIDQETKPPLDIKLLEFKIYYIVDLELTTHIPNINIAGNTYGKWIVK